MCGAMMAATLGKNIRPPVPNQSVDYASRKPRTVDSICPGVSIFLRRTFRECSCRICRPLLMMLHEYKVLWHYSNNKTYNCVKAMHKITPQKLFNTNFNIGLDAFLTRAQPFHVNVGVGMGIIRATKFFPLATVRDN